MIGQSIAHYEIRAQLGSGGMGVVYHAHDTRLDRPVALKFLTADDVGTDELRARFLREAKAAARLVHPNVATVYAIETPEGEPSDMAESASVFIVMEYIEGDSLDARIAEGPLPLAEAIEIALQVGAGLEAAHTAGIVHRDVKPSNVMWTPKGQVKVMDFGLARLTDTSVLTREGQTMGTVAYMSPEQANAETLDARTDIWSLGVVLYEMIAGRRPFLSTYDQAIIYAILNENPEPLTALRTGVPMALEQIVHKCLAKDPAARYQHVADLMVDLRAVAAQLDADRSRTLPPTRLGPVTNPVTNPVTGPVTSPVTSPPISPQATTAAALSGISGPGISGPGTSGRGRVWRGAWMVAALLLGLALGAFGWQSMRSSAPAAPAMAAQHLSLTLPEAASPVFTSPAPSSIGRPALALSPDGRHLVYVGRDGADARLYLRPLDADEARPMPGTEGAFFPFFSPDGAWIGFFVGSMLKKVAVAGGTPIVLCEAVPSLGAHWGTPERIVFSNANGTELAWVSAAGGTPTVFATEYRSGGFNWPFVLPGGQHVLVNDFADIYAVSIETGEMTPVLRGGAQPRYVPTGHLLFAQAGRLLAAPFDLATRAVTGPSRPVLDGLRTEAYVRGAQYTVSDAGLLVYAEGGAADRSLFVWVDADGTETPLPLPPETYGSFRLSPDGRQLAFTLLGDTGSHIWVYDLAGDTDPQRFTVEGNNRAPVWTPDGRRIAFMSSRNGAWNLFWKPVGGGVAEPLVVAERTLVPSSWMPDGQALAYFGFAPETRSDLWLYDLGTQTSRPLVQTRFEEWEPRLSPNGRFVAYVSDESGQNEVYVKTNPPTDQRWQLSSGGGEDPAWAPGGAALLFSDGRRWHAVPVTTEGSFSHGSPQPRAAGDFLNVPGHGYDVSPDGERFLFLKSIEPDTPRTTFRVVVNWFGELDRLAPLDGASI